MEKTAQRELVRLIKLMHGCDATFVRTETVEKARDDQVDWDGKISVFSVNHPEADICYVWPLPPDFFKEVLRRHFHRLSCRTNVSRCYRRLDSHYQLTLVMRRRPRPSMRNHAQLASAETGA